MFPKIYKTKEITITNNTKNDLVLTPVKFGNESLSKSEFATPLMITMYSLSFAFWAILSRALEQPRHEYDTMVLGVGVSRAFKSWSGAVCTGGVGGGYPGGMVFKSAPSCHTEPALCVDAVGGAEQIGTQHTEHWTQNTQTAIHSWTQHTRNKYGSKTQLRHQQKMPQHYSCQHPRLTN